VGVGGPGQGEPPADGSQPAGGRRGQGLLGQMPDVIWPAHDGVAGDQRDLPFGDVARSAKAPLAAP
jgi:hypothetical protein